MLILRDQNKPPSQWNKEIPRDKLVPPSVNSRTRYEGGLSRGVNLNQ